MFEHDIMIENLVVEKKIFLNLIRRMLMFVYERWFLMLSTYMFDKNHFYFFVKRIFETKDIDEYNY